MAIYKSTRGATMSFWKDVQVSTRIHCILQCSGHLSLIPFKFANAIWNNAWDMGFPCRLENNAHHWHDVYPLEHTIYINQGVMILRSWRGLGCYPSPTTIIKVIQHVNSSCSHSFKISMALYLNLSWPGGIVSQSSTVMRCKFKFIV